MMMFADKNMLQDVLNQVILQIQNFISNYIAACFQLLISAKKRFVIMFELNSTAVETSKAAEQQDLLDKLIPEDALEFVSHVWPRPCAPLNKEQK